MRLVHEPVAPLPLDEYAADPTLSAAVDALRHDAAELVPSLRGRRVWMINSTDAGGGVAELLPTHVAMLRDLGVDVRWAVIESHAPEFFAFTKRLHNLIHDLPEPHPVDGDRACYDSVSRQNAEALSRLVSPDDILVVHDPQPLAVGALLRQSCGARIIWRCHIGLEDHTSHTRAAWQFLRPYAGQYDRVVFSLAEYIPDFLRAKASVIHPSIDPLNHKNRPLALHKLVGVLSDAGLVMPHWPLLEPPFPRGAQRLQADGTFAAATAPDDIGLIARPIITQVSRWDRLKGFAPLLDAFHVLKCRPEEYPVRDERHRRRLETVRLVLAGPDPGSIPDDPESASVIESLVEKFRALEPHVQSDVALVTLPMTSLKHNALMVNALQRASDVVVQNSLQEGFGLTVAEALWKRTPVLGSGHASGVRLQIRDGVNGRLAPDPEDSTGMAALLHEMLADSDRLEAWGRNGQRLVHDEFLVLGELRQWLQLLAGRQ